MVNEINVLMMSSYESHKRDTVVMLYIRKDDGEIICKKEFRYHEWDGPGNEMNQAQNMISTILKEKILAKSMDKIKIKKYVHEKNSDDMLPLVSENINKLQVGFELLEKKSEFVVY
jgi:hypothetical protein